MSPLTITIIQTDIHWEDKNSNLQMLEKKIAAIKDKTMLILLPEMFSTGFSMEPQKFAETMDGESVSWMNRIAAEKKAIIAGSLIIEEAGQYYNRLIWALPNGQLGFYDKRHRFAFAGEDEQYTAGSKRVIASANGWRIQLLVCYDLRFPVWSRQDPAYKSNENPDACEYDLLICVANWPDRRIHAWKTLLQARAIENQCYVVGVNRVGKDGNDIQYPGESMVVDPMGEVIYQKRDAEDVFTITLDKEDLQKVREKFPFWRDRDYFVISQESGVRSLE